ncbi:uncharacterized protein LY89DRAFT_227416 [Mollisia scopiformis]|uniref:Uncharacterized protein n=1 Tax=Mollisia scopiformis TaxID=149040 RepID=A0A194WVE2_MOLSC|nr:uncharacterized protein LY89DRAFT_227416 [Mollisia scopiformis]KUJ11562.1 hypothetical protein LY89DRAFT_227416 [Mollisia scopiformis]
MKSLVSKNKVNQNPRKIQNNPQNKYFVHRRAESQSLKKLFECWFFASSTALRYYLSILNTDSSAPKSNSAIPNQLPLGLFYNPRQSEYASRHNPRQIVIYGADMYRDDSRDQFSGDVGPDFGILSIHPSIHPSSSPQMSKFQVLLSQVMEWNVM